MNRIKYELKNLNIWLATSISIVFIFIDFIVWCVVGSPMYVLHLISCKIAVFPLWIFGLADFLSFAAVGFSLGAVLGDRSPVCEVAKYRGAFYFIIRLDARNGERVEC